jgi:HAD superfamily hydrolase (TIGR01549 family)
MNDKQTYSLFIFDFDGTLSDSRLNIANSCNAALTSVHLPTIENEKIYPLIGKLNLEDTFTKFYPNLTVEEVNHLVDVFRAYQIAHVQDEITLFPDVAETLEELVRKGKYLAILTTKGTEQVTKILELLKLRSLFTVIMGKGSEFGEKPEGRCIDYITSLLPKPISKENIAMVGDTEIDVQTANNGGISVIGVTYGIDSAEQLKQAGATYTIDRIKDLLLFV